MSHHYNLGSHSLHHILYCYLHTGHFYSGTSLEDTLKVDEIMYVDLHCTIHIIKQHSQMMHIES